MSNATPDFSREVAGVKGTCPVGETYANDNIAARRIPVLSCEGACIRGEIARLAASMVAREVPSYARACHAETFFVPHSAMARWVQGADHTIMIDGCFLRCHGRVLEKLVGEDRVIRIDALPLHKKYTDVFAIEDVPERERNAVARHVADQILEKLSSSGSQLADRSRSR